MRSIRNQLLVWVFTTFFGMTVLVSLVAYYVAGHELEEVFDAELAQSARMISYFTVDQIDYNQHTITGSSDNQQEGHKYEKHISFQIWQKDDPMLKSMSAPGYPLAEKPGFSHTQVGDRIWRVFALYPPNTPYRIYTASDDKVREDLSLNIIKGVGLLVVWILPMLAVLVYLGVRKGLLPLNNLSRQVKNLDVDALSSLRDEGSLQELKPLVTAINTMLRRLQEARDKERRFIADASHELRTPLSGIKLHAQLARQATSEKQRQKELEIIDHAVDRSARLIEQMLTLARLEPGTVLENNEPIQLLDLIGEVISQLSGLIDEQGCQISVHNEADTSDISVHSNRLLLHTLLRNLMDNAIRYGGRDGELEIYLVPEERSTLIRVRDHGPGIPQEHLPQITERFCRLAGQEVDGCGLGLSIATAAATSIGATLDISNCSDGPGLNVELRLPCNDPAESGAN